VKADGPREHVGLGLGTALSLAVARAFAGNRPVAELAALTGRGQRSGIGVHGFARGGFLVDAGKVGDAKLSTLHARLDFPASWRVVLLQPTVAANWHGEKERAAFARPRDPAAAQAGADRLWEIAVDELIPAVQLADFPAFADAAYRYNRLAGEPFAADQGGTYTGPRVAEIIETLRGWGVAGVGQSSWGPTVFAFAEDNDAANRLEERARNHFPKLAEVIVTRANNTGAVVSTD
jgi:beta-RFAP synthase